MTSQPTLPPWQVVCLTINVIMGSGFLNVPYGFIQAGLLLGPLVLLVVSGMQLASSCLLAEVCCRAHALVRANRKRTAGVKDSGDPVAR